MTISCAHCGQPCDRHKPGQRYCSKTCKWRAQDLRNKKPPPVPAARNCLVCDRVYTPRPQASCPKYCSLGCKTISRRMREGRPVTPITKDCKVCGKEYTPHSHARGRQKYCSRSCSDIAFGKAPSGVRTRILGEYTVSRPSLAVLAARDREFERWAAYHETPNNRVLGDPPPWRSALWQR